MSIEEAVGAGVKGRTADNPATLSELVGVVDALERVIVTADELQAALHSLAAGGHVRELPRHRYVDAQLDRGSRRLTPIAVEALDAAVAAYRERMDGAAGRSPSSVEWSQRAVCARYGAPFAPSRPEQMCAVSIGVYEGDPVQAVRYPAPAHMSGWYVTTARYNGDHTTLKVEHMAHLMERRPDVAAFLALPPGYRVALDDRAAEAWFDAGVAAG